MQPGGMEASHHLLPPPSRLEPLTVTTYLPSRSSNKTELQPFSDHQPQLVVHCTSASPHIRDEDATELGDDSEMHGLISSDLSISGSKSIEDIVDMASIMDNEFSGQINNGCIDFDSRGLCLGDRTALVDDVMLENSIYTLSCLYTNGYAK